MRRALTVLLPGALLLMAECALHARPIAGTAPAASVVPLIAATPPAPVAKARGTAKRTREPLPDSHGKRVLRLFYYHPSDRPPLDGYEARLEKLLRHAQDFYCEGMHHYGLPAAKMHLDAKDGRLVIHVVRGRPKLAEHRRGKTEAGIERDVAAAIKEAGLDSKRETVMVFSNLLSWKGAQNTELGPYYGRWDAARGSGICYAFDDPRLDPDKLRSKEPGGWYVDRACSIGQFNSHYIGGILHELGHALGLPHEGESSADHSTRGTSLMGAGNHTYGENFRGEGRGTFLTKTSAYGLAQHPLFRTDPTPTVEPELEWKELRARKDGTFLAVRGRISCHPAPFCVSVFADPAGGLDYDAMTDTVPVGKDGTFELKAPDLRPSVYEARIIVTAQGGGRRSLTAPFTVNADGSADLSLVEAQPVWQGVYRAWSGGQKTRAVGLAKLAVSKKASPENQRVLAILERLDRPAPPTVPEKAPASIKSLPLSSAAWTSAQVGWGAPQRDQVQPFEDHTPCLHVAGKLYDRGLFAHAPSRYAFRPGKSWQKLVTAFGVQDGLGGSVVFVIRGDGKELFRSATLKAGQVGTATVSLKGVTGLELLTEDAGDTGNSDWGVWLNPVLSR